MKKIIVSFFSLILLYSCATKSTATKSASTTKPVEAVKEVVETNDFAEGKNLYQNNCAKCHNLYDTKSFSDEEWQPILLSMQKKAHLNDADRIKIYNYVTSTN